MYIVDGSNDVVRSARSNRCSISAPNTNAKNAKARRARAKEQDEREPLLDICIAYDDLGCRERRNDVVVEARQTGLFNGGSMVLSLQQDHVLLFAPF